MTILAIRQTIVCRGCTINLRSAMKCQSVIFDLHTYMVGGWWVVDTIPFQNIYFSTITLGDDLLVLFPATDTEFAISGIIFRMATKSIANTHNLWSICIYFNYPRASFQEIDWAREGGGTRRREEQLNDDDQRIRWRVWFIGTPVLRDVNGCANGCCVWINMTYLGTKHWV